MTDRLELLGAFAAALEAATPQERLADLRWFVDRFLGDTYVLVSVTEQESSQRLHPLGRRVMDLTEAVTELQEQMAELKQHMPTGEGR